MRYEVAIVVRVEQSKNSAHSHSVKRCYSFGDNTRYMAAGAANALMQTAEELATAIYNEEDAGSTPLSNGTSGWPVVMS
jgi:hypothetical protein